MNSYHEASRMVERKSKGLMAPGMDMSAVMDGINKKARDNARTPMHVCSHHFSLKSRRI